jgi:hypothetical protein
VAPAGVCPVVSEQCLQAGHDVRGRIDAQWRVIGQRFTLTIDDSASTVPLSDMPRLFELLYRAGATPSSLDGLHATVKLPRSPTEQEPA